MLVLPALISLLATTSGELPDDSASIAITVAQANVFDGFDDRFRYGIEYRFAPLSKFELIPVAGITTAANGASFVYGDLRRTFPVSDGLSIQGSFGLGRYDPGDIIDLGHLLEFRTGAMIVYHMSNDYDLELALYHFSNGGIGHTNPGTEALVLSISIPVGNPR